jgi:hypothetical protein
MSQRETFACNDEGDDDLLAIAAVVARVAALGEIVVFSEAFEIAAGEIVQEKIVVELKERAEALLQIVLDADLGLESQIEGAIKAVFSDGFIGDAEQIVEGGRAIPMLGQGELAARLAEAVDDFDGYDVGGRHGLFVLGHVARDDAIEAHILPQPARQPDIAEASGVGPGYVA